LKQLTFYQILLMMFLMPINIIEPLK